MDTKQNQPSIAQKSAPVLNPKSGPADLSSFMAQFAIRTMGGDLKKETKTLTKTLLPPQPITAPLPPPLPPKKEISQPPVNLQRPAIPTKEELPKISEREAKLAIQEAAQKAEAEAARDQKEKITQIKKTRQDELDRLWQQTKLKFSTKEFRAAINEAQKIVTDKQAGWWLSWRATRLIDQAQKAIRRIAAERSTASLIPTDNLTPEIKQETPAPRPSILPEPKPEIAPLPPKVTPDSVFKIPANLPLAEEILAIETPPAMPAPPPPPLLPEKKPEPPPPIKKPVPAPFKMPFDVDLELQKEQAAVAKPKKTDIFNRRILLVGLPSILILALIFWGLWFFWQKPPAPSPTPTQASASPIPRPSDATPSPAPIKPALFKSDGQKIFTLKTGQEKTDFQEALAQLTLSREATGNFTFLLFKNIANQYLPLNEIAALVGIDLLNLPTQNGTGTLKDLLDMQNFSFFVYSQTSTSSSPFLAQSNVGRFGLIIKIKNVAGANDQLIKGLRDLEQLMPSDLKLLLGDAKNRIPANPIFSDSRHRDNIAIRYINFPIHDHSLDYAILNGNLIFSTSKESLRAALDKILEP